MLFHDDGKVAFDHIYTQSDPRAYFTALRQLDYCIPQLAKPHFADLIAELHELRGGSAVSVLDIGCSYGINAALLRCDATMDELYGRYCGPEAARQTREELLASDRSLVTSRGRADNTRYVGLDTAHDALSYAHLSGFIDSAVHADLERDDPTPEQAEQLADVDLVISTGCIGYITERTISRVVRANRARPWMAHFVLRMYPFEPVAQCLAGFGYHTVHVGQVFKQRRFASAEEKSAVLETLTGIGVDSRGLEDEGWLLAQLFVSRPSVT